MVVGATAATRSVAADLKLSHRADGAVSHLRNPNRQQRRDISRGCAGALESRRTPLSWLNSASAPTTRGWERQSRKPDLVFPAFSRKVLREIAMVAIAKWEKSHRESVAWRHERNVQDRRAAIAAVEREREEARQRREAELKALEDRRRRLFEEALDGLVRSDRIRSLVAALEEHFEKADSEARTSLAHWKHWALAQADEVDPRLRSGEQLTAWIGEFRQG